MQEKLTILIDPERKKFVKKYARQQNKSISRVIDELLSSVQWEAGQKIEKDEWVLKTAGKFNSGYKNILAGLTIKRNQGNLNLIDGLLLK